MVIGGTAYGKGRVDLVFWSKSSGEWVARKQGHIR